MNSILSSSGIFDHMAALADLARCRIVALLEGRELTVSDLCTVLQMPQSTVSRQLKTLSDAGWVDSQPDGTRRLYRATLDRLEEGARQLWQLTREEIEASDAGRSDQSRLASLLAARSRRSGGYFEERGGDWDARRDALFGPHFYLFALVGLGEADWQVADLGCGTGPISEALAPFVAGVVGIDASRSMLELAEGRLKRFDNVTLREGTLEALPLDDASFDIATLCLVLHHVADPSAVLREAARILKPGGRTLIVDMLPHDREAYRQEMGHRWLGFADVELTGWIEEAGLEAGPSRTLPPSTAADGPGLFTMIAKKPNPGGEIR